MVITTFAIPLDKLLAWLINNVEQFALAGCCSASHSIDANDLKNEHLDDDDSCKSELYDINKNLSRRSKILRAARLRIMQEDIDFVSPIAELDTIIYHQNCDHWAGSGLHVGHIHGDGLQASIAAGYALLSTSFDDRGTPLAAAKLVALAKRGATSSTLNKILKVRKQAKFIRGEIACLATKTQREKYLIKSFIVESLSGLKKEIARRYLLERIDHSSERSKFCIRLFSSIFLPLFLAFMAFYIFLFGVSIGPDATKLWLQGSAFATLQDIFLLQPLKICKYSLSFLFGLRAI